MRSSRTIAPQAQQFMADRVTAVAKTVPSSHAAFLAHAKEVTDIILLSAKAA